MDEDRKMLAVIPKEPSGLARRDDCQHFPLSPIHAAQLEAMNAVQVDDDGDALGGNFDKLPPAVRADKEFASLFASAKLHDGRRALLALTPIDTARPMIISIGLRHSLQAATIFELMKLWHEMRLLGQRVEDDEEYDPDSDNEFSDDLFDETPTDEEFQSLYTSAAQSQTAILAANTPSFAGDDLDVISKMLCVKIAGWVQYGQDKPEFALSLADGRTIIIGSATDVFNQSRFREKLYAATGIAFPEFKKDQWLKLCNRLGKIRSVGSKPNEERTAIFDSFGDYAQCKLDEEKRQAIMNGRPFVHDGRLYLRADDRAISRKLKASGFRRSSLTYRTNAGDITSRSFWYKDADDPAVKRLLASGNPVLALPSPM